MSQQESSKVEVSRIAFQFGKEIQGKGETSVRLRIDLDGEKVAKELESLKLISKGALDLDSSSLVQVVTIPELTMIEADEIKKVFDLMGSESLWKFRVKMCIKAKDTYMYSLFHESQASAHGMSLTKMIEGLIEAGLAGISKEPSFVEVKFDSTGSFGQVTQKTKEVGLWHLFLDNASFEAKFQINKNFSDNLNKVFEKMSPSASNMPPLIFLGYFKNLDVDLKLESFSALEPFAQDVFKPEEPLNISERTFGEFITVFEKISKMFKKDPIEYTLIIPNVALLKANLWVPGFDKMISK